MTVCRFRFPKDSDMESIEAQFSVAFIAAECAFGQPKVRISTSYNLSREKTQLIIDVSTEVGELIAQVFTGLLIRQFGEDSFTVERLEGKVSGKGAGK